MVEYLEVEQAIARPGLRLVLSEGVPGPWGEAAKGIFQVKKLPYAPVRQVPGAPNEALARWTGQAGAPVAVYAGEAPRSEWAQILFLAERLEPTPSLIPADAEERAWMFGLAREVCGELGFGWCRRLMMLHALLAPGADVPEAAREVGRRLGARYGYDPKFAESAARRALPDAPAAARRLHGPRSRPAGGG